MVMMRMRKKGRQESRREDKEPPTLSSSSSKLASFNSIQLKSTAILIHLITVNPSDPADPPWSSFGTSWSNSDCICKLQTMIRFLLIQNLLFPISLLPSVENDENPHLGLHHNRCWWWEKARPCTSTANGSPSSTSTRRALTIARMIHMLYKHCRAEEEAEQRFVSSSNMHWSENIEHWSKKSFALSMTSKLVGRDSIFTCSL